jgi:hypothetical protein
MAKGRKTPLVLEFEAWREKQREQLKKGRGRRVEIHVPADAFTLDAPFIESAIETAESAARKNSQSSHLQESSKELVRIFWAGLESYKLDAKSFEIRQGIQALCETSIDTMATIPSASAFHAYFKAHAELVFEVCSRVSHWRSLQHDKMSIRLLRFLMTTPVVRTSEGSHVSLLDGDSSIPKAGNYTSVLKAFAERIGQKNLQDPQLLAAVRHRYLQNGAFRRSLEQRTQKLGITHKRPPRQN